MAATVYSFAIAGVDGYLIEVEADTVGCMQTVSIVGLGDTAVKESRDRLQAAITHSGYDFPLKKMIINLAPSHMKKSGSHFDVPMAIALLLRTNQININLKSFALIGELSLNGAIRPCSGILPMAIAAKNQNIKYLIVANENVNEAALVKGLIVIGASTLHDVIKFLSSSSPIPTKTTCKSPNSLIPELDFSDVKGHETLIEYLTVAAAGGHNLLMIGPPGCGKSMIAKRIPTILPSMSEEEALDVTKIYSVANLLQGRGLIQQRPFRAPHHNASANSLIGGGNRSMPGEISLAHHGVLFLDEIAEFPKKTLDALRQPMEDRRVTISRVHSTNTYPANFMLIAAMNPCPCGYFGQEKCKCTDYEVVKYRNKLSGPILDRIDIQKYVRTVNFFDEQNGCASSSSLRERVSYAREIQQKRYEGASIYCNAELTPSLIKKHCRISFESEELIKLAYEFFSYSGRTIHKFVKIARTLADLDQSKSIELKHVRTALLSRDLDREQKEMNVL